MNIILCRTGWMNYYRGFLDNDQLINGGRYVDTNKTGHEIFNFNSVNNMFYGNVQTTHDGSIKLQRISARLGVNAVAAENVLVIWCATAPRGGTVVVGWYKNAEVFRDYQVLPSSADFADYYANDITAYRISARSDGVALLDPRFRNFEIPRSGGNNCTFGRSHIRYMDEERCGALKENLYNYVSQFHLLDNRLLDLTSAENADQRCGAAGRGPADPQVETMAIRLAKEFYKSKGYHVKSVERLNRGWDLEATKNGNTLYIEVKGLSGKECSVGLTPNEYRAFCKGVSGYRLFIATSCLSDNPNKFLGKMVNNELVFKEIDRCHNMINPTIPSVTIEVKSAIVSLGKMAG
ncbi:MAG: protein NO VEIN domain-containing protein [Acidithiobacillus sp.]